MGQRVQIFISLPEVYYNEGNPNNRGRKVIALHNQWLYGALLLQHTERLLLALKYHFAEKDIGARLQEDNIASSLAFANVLDPDDPGLITKTRLYFDNFENDESMKYLAEARTIKEFVDHFDNNNGYVLIWIEDNGLLQYDILTGPEDDDNAPRTVTPLEYLRQFKKDANNEDIPVSLRSGQFHEGYVSGRFMEFADELRAQNPFKKGQSVRITETGEEYIVYAIYDKEHVSLCTQEYPETESDEQIHITKIELIEED